MRCNVLKWKKLNNSFCFVSCYIYISIFAFFHRYRSFGVSIAYRDYRERLCIQQLWLLRASKSERRQVRSESWWLCQHIWIFWLLWLFRSRFSVRLSDISYGIFFFYLLIVSLSSCRYFIEGPRNYVIQMYCQLNIAITVSFICEKNCLNVILIKNSFFVYFVGLGRGQFMQNWTISSTWRWNK